MARKKPATPDAAPPEEVTPDVRALPPPSEPAPQAGVEDQTPGDYGALPPFDPVTARTSEPRQVQVRLLKPHTHAGADYPAGARIEVPPRIAAWLRSQGVI